MSIKLDSYDMKFIDSFNFLPMALSKLTKTFAITELEKGFFPHFLNTPENQHYRGPLPHPEMYGYSDMKSTEDQGKFMTWYNRLQSRNFVFDFQEELLKYCKSDVDILRRCCMKFRDDFISTTNIDPFDTCLTVASACNTVYRTNFLKENTIAIVPANGYQPKRKYSNKALKYLMYVSHSEGVHVQHALNGGEHRVGRYSLDGFISSTKEVLEFHGCLFHGCPDCYSPETINPVNKKTMQELYEATLLRKRFLEKQGLFVREMWECQYERLLKSDPEMKNYIDSLEIQNPLEPRQAFFGGRTNAACLFYEVKPSEKIKYVDFCSLYPWVNKYCDYPLYHPEIITQDFGDISEYFGIIKCDILPPRGLLHPVLPMKCNNKLMFPLCRTCAENLQQEPCQHSDEERMLKGTWVSLEIQKAIEKGYIVSSIHEVWHYEQKTDELFKEYIKTFQKLKQEASGWPATCDSEEKKLQYIEDYFEREGVRMVYTNVMQNPGLRALAKLMLNSFWGKFGQRQNLGQVSMVKDPKHYFNLLTDESLEVTNILPVNEEVLEVRYRQKDEFIEASGRTNVVIAAFTTAHARLKLYSVLEMLEDRVLYFDTDSIIYISREGEYEPPLGEFLGELTDELDNHFITTFTSGGPKNYAYELENGSSAIKVRGITLNSRSSQVVNFNTLKQMVKNFDPVQEAESVQVYEPNRIIRNPRTRDIYSQAFYKDYRVVYEKRVVKKDFFTVPYGY